MLGHVAGFPVFRPNATKKTHSEKERWLKEHPVIHALENKNGTQKSRSSSKDVPFQLADVSVFFSEFQCWRGLRSGYPFCSEVGMLLLLALYRWINLPPLKPTGSWLYNHTTFPDGDRYAEAKVPYKLKSTGPGFSPWKKGWSPRARRNSKPKLEPPVISTFSKPGEWKKTRYPERWCSNCSFFNLRLCLFYCFGLSWRYKCQTNCCCITNWQ